MLLPSSSPPICTAAGCSCPAGLLACGATCNNPRVDPTNCGACGRSCGGGACDDGQCVCPSNLLECAAGCVDTTSDSLNCSGCGKACAAADRCQSGQCMPQCTPACVSGQMCVAGQCQCPAGLDFCAGACVDTKTTPQHCGACQKACGAGQLCQQGQCACPAGQITCDNQCADVQISSLHCGACGRACAASEVCMAGTCRGPAGGDGCGGLATDLSIAEVAAYQSIKIPLTKAAAAIEPDQRVAAIIQGRPTVFRVSVTVGAGFQARELSARVTIKNGALEDQYFAKQRISKSSTDAESASTFQVFVPKEKIVGDTRYTVELVECGAAIGGSPMAARAPATGDAGLGARDNGTLTVRILPVVANGQKPDISERVLAVYRNYLEAMYPVAKVNLLVGKELNTSYPVDWNTLIEQIRAQRQSDKPVAEEYYYGFLKPTGTLAEYCRRGCTAGVGFVGSATQTSTHVAVGLAYGDEMSAATMAHEVGHNLGRGHAPCAPGNQISGVDSRYPYARASTGVWGFDPRKKTLLNPATTTDIMGYCDPKWISDYTYKGISDRLASLNALILSEPGSIQRYRVLIVDANGPRWSQPFPEAAAPYGEAESADILDIDGQSIAQVTVYRTDIGDGDGASVLVPEPSNGWHSVKLLGALPLPFTAPITVPEPIR